MDVLDAIRSRRSIRSFADEPVSRETVQALVDAAGQAPSPHNSQPWRFHVVMGEVKPDVLAVLTRTTLYLDDYLKSLPSADAAAVQSFFSELGGAPVVIAVSLPSADDEISRINDLLATGGAVQNLQLAAREAGLGSCAVTFSFWVRDDLARVVGVSDDREIVSLVLVGHPAGEAPSPGRSQEIAEFVD